MTTIPPDDSATIGAWRGTYVPHGWVWGWTSDADIAHAVDRLAANGFTHQIHNIGRFDASGAVPPSEFQHLDEWIRTSRAHAPSQRIVAWLSGSESQIVDNRSVHAATARWISTFTSTHDIDMIMLDVEPFSTDNPRLIELLTAIRAANPALWIGIDAPAPASRWSTTFIGRVAALVDAVSPMVYDSGLTSVAEYRTWVRDALNRYRGAVGDTLLLPSIPAYEANSWHDRSVETITNAAAGIDAAGGVAGAAVFWWYEFTEADGAMWADATG